MIEVVAALIWKDDRLLICRRPAHKGNPLLWEFVGGKVEVGERHEDALVRECMGELNVRVSVGEALTDVVHQYPDATVHLTFFQATILSGEPQKLEHCDLKWITPDEIPNYQFCPADEGILSLIGKGNR